MPPGASNGSKGSPFWLRDLSSAGLQAEDIIRCAGNIQQEAEEEVEHQAAPEHKEHQQRENQGDPHLMEQRPDDGIVGVGIEVGEQRQMLGDPPQAEPALPEKVEE